ncbi:hypothetical protein MBGDN05_00255 [Thermoplasmatales archaeon SCGC AB-539-N05]|nr:hypothetical protein MBGDN05_00255 [Thermoplasmatales archaeon SCGC AB-539-N05]
MLKKLRDEKKNTIQKYIVFIIEERRVANLRAKSI